MGFAVLGALAEALVGKLVKVGIAGIEQDDWLLLVYRVVIAGLVTGVIYATMTVFVLQQWRNLLAQKNEQLQKLTTDERLARQLADAKLRLMQAQVEPHFLFNTLASVQHLAEPGAPEAARLTAQLIAFLRGGLSGLREEFTTLEREFAMAASYLEIMKTRMGPRLNFNLQLPVELAGQNVPPAMLISLIENAIKHGLEAAPEGGRIDLVAKKHDHQLIIEVIDTGLGCSTNTLNVGLGLTNINERLKANYGDQAALVLSDNHPAGFIATLTFRC